MKRTEQTQIAAVGGTTAAITLPGRISASVAGVASRGSRLRSIFSPTRLHPAIAVGRIAARG